MITLTQLCQKLDIDGGFTATVVNGQVTEYVTSGYALSIYWENEQHFPHGHGELVASFFLASYLDRHAESLNGSPTLRLGAWLDRETNTVYLDISQVVTDLDKALDLGRQYGQLAVFHLDTGTEIRTGIERNPSTAA